MKYLTILFFLLIFKIAFPQAQYYLSFDKTLSEDVGAENIITIHKALYRFENSYLPLKLSDESTVLKKMGGISYRLGKSFISYNFSYLGGLIQHEVFGHGSRYREYGQTESSYHLSLPFPLGNGGGYARSGSPAKGPNRLISNFESCAKIFGGMEGGNILANRIRTKWFLNNSISNQEFMLYIFGRHNSTAYILSTEYKTAQPGNDVVAYLDNVNYINGNNNPFTSGYNLDVLKKHTVLTLADPLTYIAGINYLFSYVLKGNESAKMPMIKFGQVRYLPSFRLGLSPFGSEFYSEHFALYNKKLIEFYYRQSDGELAQTYGGGMKLSYLINNKYFAVHTAIDFWNQPKMVLGGSKLYYTPGGAGGAFGATAVVNLLKKDNQLGLMVNAGYKTAGYSEGEKLAQGAIIRIGLSFTEGKKSEH